MAHLRPRVLEDQAVLSSELLITPKPCSRSRKRDYFGNECDMIEVLAAHDSLEITSQSVVKVTPGTGARSSVGVDRPWDQVGAVIRSDPRYLRERELAFDSPLVRAHRLLREYGAAVLTPGRPIVDAVLELNQRIFDDFTYEPTATDVSTPLGRVMRERRGVCQDFAHVAIGCLRSMGLGARYVSGYLETTPPPGKARLVGADASHAWASVFIPERGWFDFDPTNAIVPGGRHITVAWGRDFSDVSPLKGVVVGGAHHVLSVGVDVEARPDLVS
jgi:transglutaminase-like putative cysteine protease